MSHESLLINNGTILTVDDANTVIEGGAILVQGDRIKDIGPTSELRERHEPQATLDAGGNLVIPGLINAHTHGLYYLTRGLGMDGPLLDWLGDYIGPLFLDISEEEAYDGALLSFLENLRMGSTLVVDNFYAPAPKKYISDRVAEAAADSGIRAVLARCYVDRPGRLPPPYAEDIKDIVLEYERLVTRWHNQANGRLQVCVAPITLPSCTPESIQRVHELAEHFDLGMHTHCAETQESLEMVREQHGRGFVEVFDGLGVLGPSFQSVHSVWLAESELRLLRDTDSRVIHNPVANMLLGEGIAPVPKLRRLGIKVALGTDSPNNSQDMIQAMKSTVLLHRVAALDALVLSANDVLRMATIDGARALRMDHEVGSLEVGKKADIVIVDVHTLHSVPVHDPISTLVYSSGGMDVDTVIVDGRVVLAQGTFTSWDLGEVIGNVQRATTELRGRAEARVRL